ncbi:hypothetical protein GCM10027605_12030 [Micromonospora zhanjiangensis]
MKTVASPWIRNFQPAPDAPAQLVCLPHAGGSAAFYLPMARALTPGVDVLAIQYPGRQDRRREGFVPSVQQMAELIAREIRPLLDQPTALFGHSMGAAIGFELAALLEADGADLLGLFVSGRRAPSAMRDEAVHRLADRELIEELKRLGAPTRLPSTMTSWCRCSFPWCGRTTGPSRRTGIGAARRCAVRSWC